jgi:predicted flap endonuclease-1-like 5' DNA nuclease
MITLVGEMLGCLLLAAGIGGVVGWLLRHLTAAQIAQQLIDRETELRVKEQALDTALYKLKLNAETLHLQKNKIFSLESIGRSTQQDLASRQARIRTLQDEVATNLRRISDLEAEHVALLQRLSQQDATMTAFANEVRQANAARTAAQQDLLLKEQELLDVRQRLAEAEGQRAELDHLRKRLVEVRAALRVRTDGGQVVAQRTNPADQLSLQIEQSKSVPKPERDDLKKIHGIGPVLERALNKMGTYTYIQIAKWTPDEIARVAQKLETGPDRIKRSHWIASAKKLHREKYGERI